MVYKYVLVRLVRIVVTVIRIGTRKSQLALWQANHVADLLKENHPEVEVELIKITTSGDKFVDAPLSQAGGKGLFLKELEQAMFDNEIDLAVHSMKDVTVTLPEGLHIGAILERHDVRDALVCTANTTIDQLPHGSVVGTCSLRRQCFINHHYPNLQVKNIRGNVDTRLAKLDAGDFDAIVLAAAGLERLGLERRIAQYLADDLFIPAVGQGAIGVECRSDDKSIKNYIACLNHIKTNQCVTAERVVNEKLEGGCHMPIAVYATIDSENLQMFAFVGLPDGSKIVSVKHEISHDSIHKVNPVLAGEQMTAKLIKAGAMKIIENLNVTT